MGGQLRIVTDSTCDLPPELVERYGIIVVPALIHFGDETYLDGVEITHQEMYRRMLEDDEVPKSCQPSPGQFLEVYEELAAQGISIHVTGSQSNPYQSTRISVPQVVGSPHWRRGAVETILSWTTVPGESLSARLRQKP